MKSPLSVEASGIIFPIKNFAKLASLQQPSSLLFIAAKLERLSARTLKLKHAEDALREAFSDAQKHRWQGHSSPKHPSFPVAFSCCLEVSVRFTALSACSTLFRQV